jgi:hypothetical protein
MHDRYDPPPAPLAWDEPKPEPLILTRGDVACLATFGTVLAFATGMAWSIEPTLALLATVGGTLVILESWFTALDFLHRRPSNSPSGRLAIFLAALVPWVVGLGIAATLMSCLFLISDWAGA